MSEADLTTLTDMQLLELSNMYMPDGEQLELSDLLAQNRENQLSVKDTARLEELMQIYRHGLVRKAEAMQIAVQRGLRPPLS